MGEAAVESFIKTSTVGGVEEEEVVGVLVVVVAVVVVAAASTTRTSENSSRMSAHPSSVASILFSSDTELLSKHALLHIFI